MVFLSATCHVCPGLRVQDGVQQSTARRHGSWSRPDPRGGKAHTHHRLRKAVSAALGQCGRSQPPGGAAASPQRHCRQCLLIVCIAMSLAQDTLHPRSHSTQYILVCSQSHATTATGSFKTFPLSLKGSLTPISSHSLPPGPSPRPPAVCFRVRGSARPGHATYRVLGHGALCAQELSLSTMFLRFTHAVARVRTPSLSC